MPRLIFQVTFCTTIGWCTENKHRHTERKNRIITMTLIHNYKSELKKQDQLDFK